MRNNVKKIIALAAMALAGAILFAQTEADYTILEDREITHTDWDSIIYDQSYINNVKKLTKSTKKNMNRERYATIPEELERFYDGYDDLKNIMSIDSPEGLRVRTDPTLSASKICTLPYGFNVIVTCLGPEATIDGIDSAWVEILLPQYLWSGYDQEFGWVFGGYLADKDTSYRCFTIGAHQYYYDSYDYDEYFIDSDLPIPYDSYHLHDILDRHSYFDLYCIRANKNRPHYYKSDSYDATSAEFYEYERTTGLEKLKLIFAGAIPYNTNDYYFETESFSMYWDMVQEMRQMHPVAHVGGALTYDSGIFTDETLKLNQEGTKLTYTNPDTNKVYELEIQENYLRHFNINSGDGLEISSFEPKNVDLPGPMISSLKKVYENEVIYHYETVYFSIADGTLVKCLEINTCPDFMDRYWNYVNSRIDYETAETLVYFSNTYISFCHGMNHDDCIYFKRCSEKPYIQIDKEDCLNFNIIKIGPYYTDD